MTAPATQTLLAALWPQTPENHIKRSLAIVALGVVAFASTFVAAFLASLSPASPQYFLPTLCAIYGLLLGVAFSTGRFRYAVSAVIAIAAFSMTLFIQTLLFFYYYHPLYTVPLTSAFYAGLIAAVGARLAIPVILFAALSFMVIATLFWGSGPWWLFCGGLLAHGAILVGLVAKGWGRPARRLLVASLLANLGYTLWLAPSYVLMFPTASLLDALLTASTASVLGAAGVVALIELGWQFAAKRASPAP